jgi:DNA-binding GntR family transcriptional regulator
MRAAIQSGVYPPGSRIREEEVANFVGVSRTPVREALRLLQAHGLLEIAPGRGLSVVELTKPQVIQLYEMRELLEGAAARLAAQHASPSEIAVLKHTLGLLAQEADDPKRSAKANQLFHSAIYDAAHNYCLVQSLDRLADSLALLPRTTFEIPGRAEGALDEHRAIIDAIEKREPDLADECARRHIREAQQYRLQLLFHI